MGNIDLLESCYFLKNIITLLKILLLKDIIIIFNIHDVIINKKTNL